MAINRLTRNYLKTLEELEDIKTYEIIERYYLENRSQYYFPNSLVAFYPSIREYHSRKEMTCDISTNIIKNGQLYINYRPLIENMETGDTFVLVKSIKCEIVYKDLLPTNMLEFENLNEQIMNYEYYSNSEINLDHLHYSQGGSLKIVKLKKQISTKIVERVYN